jgi:hypothetical protein
VQPPLAPSVTSPRRPVDAADTSKERLTDRIRDGRVHFRVADWWQEFYAQLTAEECEPVFNPAGVRVGQKWSSRALGMRFST